MPSGGQAQKGMELGMTVQLARVQYPLGSDAECLPLNIPQSRRIVPL